MTTVQDLQAAAKLFAARTDSFADGKAAICADLASKLERFGSFASEKQAEFAAKLVSWATPRQSAAPAVKAAYIAQLVSELDLSIDLDICKVTMFSNGSVAVVHPEFGGGVFGFIENGMFRPTSKCTQEIVDRINHVEAGELKALAELGKMSGRCCMCGMRLKDDASIRRGMGPTCAKRVGYKD
jgi:hypothetical protein